jgi:uncharacterized membrane protein
MTWWFKGLVIAVLLPLALIVWFISYVDQFYREFLGICERWSKW